MATDQITPVLPGDLIQDQAGYFYMVTETHGWGVGAIQRWRTTAEDEREHYFRLREAEFFVCGSAAMLPQEVAELRAAAIQTQAELAREAAKAAKPDRPAKPTIKSLAIRLEMAEGQVQSILNREAAASGLEEATTARDGAKSALHQALQKDAGVDPDLLARVLAL